MKTQFFGFAAALSTLVSISASAGPAPLPVPPHSVKFDGIECGAFATDAKEQTQSVLFKAEDNLMIGRYYTATVGKFEVTLVPTGLGRVAASITDKSSSRVVDADFIVRADQPELATARLSYMDDVYKRTGALVTCVVAKP